MRKLSFVVAALGFALAGCPTTDQLDHMEIQPKGKPYRTSDFFADGQLMRHPPVDTVPLEHDEGNPFGEPESGAWMGPNTPSSMPYKVDAEFLALGRAKFDIDCAVCHGFAADGNSVVARKMNLRPPPNLTTDVYRNKSDAYIFTVITNGYGYMNPYRDQLSSKERWAVVSYLRALQLSQSAPITELSTQDLKQLNAPPAAPAPSGNETRHE